MFEDDNDDDENMMALNPFARSKPGKTSEDENPTLDHLEDDLSQVSDPFSHRFAPETETKIASEEPQTTQTPQTPPEQESTSYTHDLGALSVDDEETELAGQFAPSRRTDLVPEPSMFPENPDSSATQESFTTPDQPPLPQELASSEFSEVASHTEPEVSVQTTTAQTPQAENAPRSSDSAAQHAFPQEQQAYPTTHQQEQEPGRSEQAQKTALEFAESIESVLTGRQEMTPHLPAESTANTQPTPTETPAQENTASSAPSTNTTTDSPAAAPKPALELETPPAAPAPDAPKAQANPAPSQNEPSTPANASDNEDDDKKPRKRPMRIGEKLIAHGLISEDQLQVALQEQKTRKKLLGAILVDMGFITESTLGEVLAESSGSRKFDPKSTMLDPELTRKIPKQVASRNKVIPISMSDDVLTVATPDVFNVLAIDQIKRHFQRSIKVETIYCSESEVLELIEKYYEYELSIDGILQEIETGIREKGEIDSKEDGYTNPTVRLVNAILVDAIHRGASDIHFEPEGQFLRLRYRIDGDLEQIRSFHRDYWPAIAVRIKIISGMNIAESRMPQDGRINFEIMGREVDFRVATQPTVYGENIVMRLLDKTKSLVPLGQLGFADHSITLLKRLLKRPEGIIIVTGPTGSGKTTTLYSILNYINSIDVNIMTLEDPVEYQLSLIRQSNVQEGTVDFHNGIKSLMRQDPDIIFIGEVRDENTALMTVRAALTGHQVFTTLHTNDALGAIPRLNDIGVPGHLLAGSLIATMAQRLARKLCPKCKSPRLARPDESRMLGFMPDQPPTIYDAVGCKECDNKGYKGRVAILEILNIDDGMSELIATNATRNVMLEYSLENGFITMMDDGIDKVIKGEIDIAQLIDTVDMTERL